MKRVYEAANNIEAYLLRDILDDEGITARIDGELLQGMVGDPASGLVGLSVEEADVGKALEVLRAWDEP